VRAWGRVVCACLPLALVVGCARESGPPNLVLITLDTTRRDHLSAYGYERLTSPNLARFAEQGVRFDLAYSASATTSPSHATLFTSLHPLSHGVVKNGLVLGPAQVTLAERLHERGYSTGAVVSSAVLAARLGWSQGFDSWQDSFDPSRASVRRSGGTSDEGFDARADETTERAIEWLDHQRAPGRPFFLFVHYFDPHSPYDPPAEFAERLPPIGTDRLSQQIALYDAEIAYTDEQLARLLAALDRLGLEDDTLVAITADHGEGLMQHGHAEHGVHIYEEQVRVPLLLRWPGRLPAGRVIEAPVPSIDVAPTLLELLGAAPGPDAGLQGQSLVPLLDGRGEVNGERPIFLFRRHYEPGQERGIAVNGVKHGIRLGDWKYIVGPEEGTRELFNLARDPRERENLIEAEPERASELAARLDRRLAGSARPLVAPDAISPEERERLRALGYVE